MDSHVIRKASLRLPALADIAVLRFNTRGTTSPQGTSEGAFDEARGERCDVDAAIAAGLALGAPPVVLLGWSFGTDLVLKYGRQPGSGRGRAALTTASLHLRRRARGLGGVSDIPMTVLVPELDDFLRPDEARERFAVVPQAEVMVSKAPSTSGSGRSTSARCSMLLRPLRWDARSDCRPTGTKRRAHDGPGPAARLPSRRRHVCRCRRRVRRAAFHAERAGVRGPHVPDEEPSLDVYADPVARTLDAAGLDRVVSAARPWAATPPWRSAADTAIAWLGSR